MMTKDEAEQLVAEAKKAVWLIEADIRAKVAAATAEIQAAHAEDLGSARRALAEMRGHLRDVMDQTPGHPWTGKRVFQMVRAPGQHAWAIKPDMVRIEGLVETVRSTTEFPGNTASYSKPPVGEPIVRLLTKSGVPGLRFDRMDRLWKLCEDAA